MFDGFTLMVSTHSFIHSIVDELIRQVTINCAERGILLLRYVFVFVCMHVCEALHFNLKGEG